MNWRPLPGYHFSEKSSYLDMMWDTVVFAVYRTFSERGSHHTRTDRINNRRAIETRLPHQDRAAPTKPRQREKASQLFKSRGVDQMRDAASSQISV